MFKIAKDILHNIKWLALKKKITRLALLQINFNTFHMFLVILMKCTVCLVFLWNRTPAAQTSTAWVYSTWKQNIQDPSEKINVVWGTERMQTKQKWSSKCTQWIRTVISGRYCQAGWLSSVAWVVNSRCKYVLLVTSVRLCKYYPVCDIKYFPIFLFQILRSSISM